ncbi:hypothetical protein [Dehalogenimonas formicexedens]|uniref:hypothetical protein n=1 Tax=Dehalogenimonas formicexedens TaxID=1839801 RepID=UPI0011AB621D|nr:hypothetical protein [Dehalogenimonas formicexedens]
MAIGISLVSISLFGGCKGATQTPALITFNDLVSQPASYNNRAVTVEGYFFAGFEISALSSGLVPSIYDPARLTPVQPLIWITGDLGQSVYQNLQQQSDTPSGYPEKFGHIRLTGLFQQGKFGHLDAYNFQISVTQATILP